METVCEKIHKLCASLTQPYKKVKVMEVCGTHTMAIARSGLRNLLPENLILTSGPGCPVCVTDQSYIDQAVGLAKKPDVIIATYGDMVRVPGRQGSLADARSQGAAVEIVYSADQAIELAKRSPKKHVIFLAVGFETTTPGTAMAVLRAKDESVENFFVLTAHKLILPAMRVLLSDRQVELDGFICPGHVSVILGTCAYEPIVSEFHRPCVVAGFDASQIVAALEEILRQLIAAQPKACTVYSSVSGEGNAEARKLMDRVFVPADTTWRALGNIPDSGLELREEFSTFDAAQRFDLPEAESYELPGCRCGEVITGRCRPTDCGLFALPCTPRDPVGPCMVSSEGACAAAYKYERNPRSGSRRHP